ncbi:MAG: TIR domain-containing protein [Chloroflexi bacterium]|nr:TIR domain-containing protein [Chloroflexota bacterium]
MTLDAADGQRRPGVLRIFISYRRQDAPSYARELYHALNSHFKDSQIFWDIKMELGVDFVKEIERAVGSCDVLVAVMGPNWLRMTDESGQRRLDDPSDFVRLEIATALDRNIRVIPVLVQSANMPYANDLPAPLQSLARRQAIELSDKRWDYDVGELIASLERVPFQKLVPPTGREPFPVEDQPARAAAATPAVTATPATAGHSTATTAVPTQPIAPTPTPAPAPAPPPVPTPPVIAARSSGSIPAPMLFGGIALMVVAILAVLLVITRPAPTPDPTPTAAPVAASTRAPAPTSRPTQAPTRAAATNAPATTRPAPTPTVVLTNYADELTDFGVAPLFNLQTQDRIGSATPTWIPGGDVITTMDLADALSQSSDLFGSSTSMEVGALVDALGGPAHRSIPGAHWLPDAGSSGSFNDAEQQSLDSQLGDLTTDLDTPIVFFCQGSRCWESYNASLRAIHLGYTHVWWYRGGLSAWQAAGLPLTNTP